MQSIRRIPRSLKTFALAAAVAVALVAGQQWTSRVDAAAKAATSGAPPIVIQPNLPADIPGGAQNASLAQAAAFAWQEFIALNWPAQAGVRDTPNTSLPFGNQSGPLVWETYRGKVEIFPGNGSATVGPPGYTSQGAPNYGYDQPPQYVYATTIQPCTGQTPPAQPAWVNLDEVSQIGLDAMYAGIVPAAATATNSQPQLIRFLAKANRQEYTYVAANQYWYGQTTSGSPVKTAFDNFTTAISASPPKVPQTPYIDFPDGTVEVKAGWRQLGPNDNPAQFHTTTVRYYEGTASTPCYREATWGLIALHIIHKTPSAPSFVYATFEQANNLLVNKNGNYVPVEDANGNIINPPSAPSSTTPALTYQDSPSNPQVSIVGTSYCTSPGGLLYYRNLAGDSGLPSAGNICVNSRNNPIPSDIIAANTAAHSAIASYNSQKGVKSSPWMYYKLVNVQAYPFDKTDVDTGNPNSPKGLPTFYQANIVVETDYTLQMFSGQIANNGAPTDYTTGGTLNFQNVYTIGNNQVTSVDMGGCMGCHGNAQVGGADFSFILKGGPVKAPENPLSNQFTSTTTAPAPETTKEKYRAMFPGMKSGHP